MDAREIIVGTKIDMWGAAGEAAADTILEALAAHGYQIIHRDENHGPTLERAADIADAVKELHKGSEGSHPAFATASIIATSLRAMEVKHHG